MNRIYRVVFNPQLGLWQAVCECARGRGKSRSAARALGLVALLGAARTVRATSPQWEVLHSPRWSRTLLALAAAACVNSGAMAQTIESLGDLKLVDYGGAPQPIPGDVASWGGPSTVS